MGGWSHPEVPVYWRENDLEPRPDPSSVSHFFRNEIDAGSESIAAYSGGRTQNEKCQRGAVVLRIFTSRALADEDAALDLMHDAMEIFRSQRHIDSMGNDLSFVGGGSGVDLGPSEDGNWFIRGARMAFEYRFRG
jgi:hypothetical protein